MKRGPMMCPNCGRLIGADETECSWCGARRPSRAGAYFRRGMGGDWWLNAIITANVAFYILSLAVGSGGISGNPLRMLSPDSTSLLLLGATGTVPIDRFHRIWSLVTASYLHGGLLHILFNMMALRQIGPMVVREFGSNRMFVIYSAGGVCGFVLSYLAGIPFTIGASAAVCALIGALFYYGRNRGGSYGAMIMREVSGWIVGLVLFGLLMPGINNWGHGGGMAGGYLVAMMLGYEEKRREGETDRLMALLWAAITVAVLAWAVLSAFGFITGIGRSPARIVL